MAESEEELKSLLMKVKVESEKVALKLNIQKTKIMASGPPTSWEIDGETVETVSDFIFLGSKIIIDGDCSHEIKRRLLLGRKVMTNLDSIFKSRDITLPTKVCLAKAMVFPVVMYGCESWTVKKAECWRIDALELWCWRRLLRVPWTARRSNQSILKEISPGISLEGMMLKLKLQYFCHLMQRVDLLEKTLMLGGIGGKRRGWDGWMASLTRWTWIWVNSGSWWWTGRPGVLQFMGSQRVGHDWVTELNWTDHVSCNVIPATHLLKASGTHSHHWRAVACCSSFPGDPSSSGRAWHSVRPPELVGFLEYLCAVSWTKCLYVSFRFIFTLLFFRGPHYFYNRVTLNESFGCRLEWWSWWWYR